MKTTSSLRQALSSFVEEEHDDDDDSGKKSRYKFWVTLFQWGSEAEREESEVTWDLG